MVTAAALVLNLVFTPAGNVIILAGICLISMFGLRAPLTSLAFGSVTCAGWLSSEIGKITVARLRPPTSATHALILETGHGSFPSGHTAFAASLAWAAVLVLARSRGQRMVTAAAGALFVVVVGASRLYLGVHYPSDVAGSVLISTAAIMFWLPLWNGWIEPFLRTVPVLEALSGNRATGTAAGGGRS
jgi:undecaprenyl-diphosphatase